MNPVIAKSLASTSVQQLHNAGALARSEEERSQLLRQAAIADVLTEIDASDPEAMVQAQPEIQRRFEQYSLQAKRLIDSSNFKSFDEIQAERRERNARRPIIGPGESSARAGQALVDSIFGKKP